MHFDSARIAILIEVCDDRKLYHLRALCEGIILQPGIEVINSTFQGCHCCGLQALQQSVFVGTVDAQIRLNFVCCQRHTLTALSGRGRADRVGLECIHIILDDAEALNGANERAVLHEACLLRHSNLDA